MALVVCNTVLSLIKSSPAGWQCEIHFNCTIMQSIRTVLHNVEYNVYDIHNYCVIVVYYKPHLYTAPSILTSYLVCIVYTVYTYIYTYIYIYIYIYIHKYTHICVWSM